MPRKPTLTITVSADPSNTTTGAEFRAYVTTHHWRGEKIEESYASAELAYGSIYQTINAMNYLCDAFLAMQEHSEPARNIPVKFPEHYYYTPYALSLEDKEYFDVVSKAVSQGWSWEDSYVQDIETGERKPHDNVFLMNLHSWYWQKRPLGSPVMFQHPPREGESRAAWLTRILATAEKAREDYRYSVPRMTLNGTLAVDELATRAVFGENARR